LDASSIYQAYTFLKNAVQDAKQVFLFTHNFGFLRLVLNWLTHGQLRRHSRFYMLVCRSEADGRRTALRALDKTLIDHPTEYHFLFKTLAEFRGDGTIAACYHIPNVARKILEMTSTFRERRTSTQSSTPWISMKTSAQRSTSSRMTFRIEQAKVLSQASSTRVRRMPTICLS